MHNIKALGAITLSLALAACDMAPKYVRPQLAVPAGSPQGPAYGTDGGAAIVPADTAWRDFFTDARLARVIETALVNNRDLRIALANVEQARAQYRVQRADLLPGVSAGGTATYQDSPFSLAGSGRRIRRSSNSMSIRPRRARWALPRRTSTTRSAPIWVAATSTTLSIVIG